MAFLGLRAATHRYFRWIRYAYSLMTDRYRLVVDAPDGDLSKGTRRLNRAVRGTDAGFYKSRALSARGSETPTSARCYAARVRFRASRTADRDEAIGQGYCRGGDSTRAIAEYFKVGRTTVRRAEKRQEPGLSPCDG